MGFTWRLAIAETIDIFEFEIYKPLWTRNPSGFFNDTDLMHMMSLFYTGELIEITYIK
jgi:hypothetical protein